MSEVTSLLGNFAVGGLMSCLVLCVGWQMVMEMTK